MKAAHPVAVDQIDAALLAGSGHQPRVSRARNQVRKQKRSTRTEIDISAVQAHLIEGRKIVRHSERAGGGEFEDSVAEIGTARIAVELPVAGYDVDVALRIRGGRGAAHPQRALKRVRRKVECRGLPESRSV